MGTQNKEIKIALDIQAKIDKASNQINTLKKQIDNFELSKGLAGDFAKEFKNIEHEIAELQRRTASGEINLIDAKAAEKEIDKIEKRWAFLLSKVGGESFLEKGLKADAQAMAALQSLAKSYAAGIKEAEQQETKLNKKLEEAKQRQKDLAEAQKEQKVVKEAELADQKAQLAILQKQEKAAKKTRDEAEKALRAKVEESGGKYSMAEVSQKGSKLRKTDAYRTFRDAQTEYDAAQASTKAQQTNVDSMVTKGMQLAEATAAKEAIDKATEALENYRQTTLATAKEDAFEKAKESLKSIAEFKDIDWDNFNIDLSNIKSVEELEEALASLRIEAENKAKQAIEEINETAKEASTGFESLDKDVKTAKDSLVEMDEQARQTEAFEARIKQFLGMAGAVELLRRALRQAFETTKELDAAMTEMAVVTDLDVGDYWNQLPEHTKRASELGVAIHSVYEAETLYYQQGLKTAEAQELANTTLKMARIAGLDAAEATDKMTAALRGFNMELNDTSAEKVADVYSKLAAITAADVNEISSAMTKTASIASAAGMEFETTAAFLSQIIETTRESAETAGTAMKTVIARFSEVKKLQGEGLVTGQDEEGEVIDVNKIQTALRTVGISMDEFFEGTEGLDSIFLKLAEKWDTLDVKTQRYIATTAAGSRQQSRFIAMMSDYARTQELVTAANNSAGASQEQYKKTLESLESKLAKLKNAWDEFSMGILQSDLVKFGVDALTKFLEIINKATSAFDGLGGSIMKVLTVVAMFKIGQKIFEKIKSPMMKFGEDLKLNFFNFGKESGKAFVEGNKQGIAEAQTEETPKAEVKKKVEEKAKEEKSVKQKIYQSTGISNFQKAASIQEEIDKKTGVYSKKQNVNKAKAKLKGIKKDPNASAKEVYQAEDGYKRAQENLKKAEEEKKKYIASDEELKAKSKEVWTEVGAGIGKTGQALAGLGIGISMVGGMISSLGLEGAGEAVTKFGNAVTIVGGALMAIPPIIAAINAIMTMPPLGIILIILTAVVALITAIVVISKKLSLQNRMQEAAKATEAAKEQAEQAKEAYDNMVADRKGFDEMQDKLKNLTKGTKEWKEALRESNAQVLDLVQTYPELAKYITRGDQGQLTIADEGWDAMIEQQEKSVQNASAVLMNKQFAEIDLKKEKAITDRNESLKSKSYAQDNYGADILAKELENYNNIEMDNVEERASAISKISDKWSMTEEEAALAAAECQKTNDELRAAAEEAESIAQATLTTMASEEVTESEYGQQAIDAFANSMSGDVIENAVKDQTKDLKQGKDYRDSEEFDRLATEYGVASDMTGNDTHDLQTLYKAVLGVEEIPDEIASDRDAMLKAISEADQTNQMVEKMEDYTSKLEKIAETNKDLADNIASVLSDDGKDMTRDFANSFMTGPDGTGEFDKSKVDQLAKDMGYTDDEGEGGKTAVEKYAEAMGKTTAELYKEIEDNVKNAIEVNENSFKRLNKAVKNSDDKITKFGNSVKLTTEQEVGLADKIVNVASMSGSDAAGEIKTLLDAALESAGSSADELASYLGSINWQDVSNWEGMEDSLKAMGITWTTEIEAFVNKAQVASNAIKIVDFGKLNEELKSVYDTLNNLKSGKQDRSFDKDSYDQLITANKDLANQFVQQGDKYVYIGTSMGTLTQALEKNTLALMEDAADQLEAKIEMAEVVDAMDKVSYGDKQLSINQNYTEWNELELREYLESYRKAAYDDQVARGEDGDKNALNYLDTKGVGLSFMTDFENYGKEALIGMMDAIKENYNDIESSREEYEKQQRDTRIVGYTLSNAGRDNAAYAQQARAAGDEKGALEYSDALKAQAAQSGLVAESVISRYSALLEDGVTAGEEEEVKQLEESMSKSLDKIIKNQEGLDALISLQNRVAEALYTTRQKEIDKLSELNQSVQSANGNLISKIQEQIDDQRQARANEEAKQNIADLQSQQVYLGMDTSGANALEMANLDEQVKEAEQAYQDSLVDQALQELSDANNKAAEQRERQIAIMQQQLDYSRESGQLMTEAQNITNEALDAVNNGEMFENTEAAKLITTAENWQEKAPEDYEQQMGELQKTAVTAGNANVIQEMSEDTGKITGGTGDKQGTLGTIESYVGSLVSDKAKRDTAISNAAASLSAKDSGGKSSATYQQALKDYVAAGGKSEDFASAVSTKSDSAYITASGEVQTGTFPGGGGFSIDSGWGKYTGDSDDNIVMKLPDGSFAYNLSMKPDESDNRANTYLNHISPEGRQEKWLAMFEGKPYAYRNGGWRELYGGDVEKVKTAMKAKLNAYKEGGLADFTGPAWLDGTKSHPEYVLNADQTERFFSLVDILEGFDKDQKQTKSSGDNYFDIQISVEEIKDDYDVEQLANKIRRMIYDDATYRNVNTINLIR